MKILNNMMLRNKLLLCYGSLMIFAVSLVGLLTYNKIQTYIYDQSSKSSRQTFDQVIMNIEYKLSTHQELLRTYLTNKSFISALNTTYTSPADYSYQYLDTLRSIFDLETNYPSIKNIIVYKNNESLPDIGTYPDKPSISDTEHTIIDIAKAKEFMWYKINFTNFEKQDLASLITLSNETIFTVNDSQTLVSIIRPVVYNLERLVGIVEMQLKIDSVFQNLGELFYIVDEFGKLLFSNTPDQPETAIPVEALMNRDENNTSGSLLIDGKPFKKLVLYETNKTSGWTYVQEVPLSSLMLSAKSIRNFTGIILIISIVISILIAIAITRVLTRRISSLANHMERQEDLTLEIGPSVDGRDEIGMLTRSYNRMIKRINELIYQLRTSQQLQKESEIKSLQAQINPHFLYNTLATINWMAADNESKKISDMVENLAVFYRLSLNMGKEYLLISEEVKHVRAYLAIQKIRMEDKISVSYEIEEEILPFLTLKLILQPFVENAILHGAENKAGTTHIVIKGYLSSDEHCVIFEIIDDGVGMRVPVHNQYVNNGGYGIHNVNEKIQLQYGHQYGVRLSSEPGIGTSVIINIPVVAE